MNKEKVSVIIPVYNVENYIHRCLNSVISQTYDNLEIILVDDGSTDDTSLVVKTFKSDKFPIRYYLKENGGKHTALNYSHPYIKGELLFIVDSDDILTPDAINTINKDWARFGQDPKMGILSYTIQCSNGELISEGDIGEYYIDNDINYRVNKNIRGDRCEIVRSDVFKKFKFPVFAGERFMGEG